MQCLSLYQIQLTLIADNENKKDFWLRLDNAAKIYPAIRSQELTSVIRISVQLKERIKAKQFINAIREIEDRFPYYKVILKPGFFWFFLEWNNMPANVKPDLKTPCRAFHKDELMYRILVKDNRISVEFSHILTDGTGAFEFLKTLLFTYFDKCGYPIPESLPYYRSGENAANEEYEDAFNRHFKKITTPLIKITNAFHLPFTLRQKPRFDVIVGIIPLDEIAKKAKYYEVSLTEFLIAVYIYALQEVYYNLSRRSKIRSNKVIRIEVPVNLRKLYPTKTMRNFTLYVMPEIDLRLGWYTFEELTKIVYHQMHLETDKKLINKMISRNVGSERNLFIRSVPLVIKSIILSKVYAKGTSKYSGVITNLGKIDFTPGINALIERFVFIPPPANDILKVNCGVVGFDNQLVLSFGNITISKKLEQSFFRFLVNEGIKVKIEKY